MTPNQIHDRIASHLPGAKILVEDLTGGHDHYQVTIETSQFQGMSRLKQHQLVMSFFSAELESGEVHALSLKTQTP